MKSKRHLESEYLTDFMQMGYIGMKVFMGVCSLLMAHHRRQVEGYGPRTSCLDLEIIAIFRSFL